MQTISCRLIVIVCLLVAANSNTVSAQRPRTAKAFADGVLKQLDQDGDNKVAKSESRNRLKQNFDKVDSDGDGFLDESELLKLGSRLAGNQRPDEKRNGGQRSDQKPATENSAAKAPDNVVLKTDVAYREGNKKWKLDIAKPKSDSKEPRPAIVFIHGGGWRSGDKGGGQWRSMPLEYASRGYVCISVNYRLTDEGTILDCIADCKCAVRWLRASAKEHNVDPQRIGAYGNSAGAHLVAILGLTTAAAKLEGDGPYAGYSSEVQAVCCSATPSNFLDWGKRKAQALEKLFGADPQNKKLASPVTWVTAAAPPFLIVHGTADKTVPFQQGVNLHSALEMAGAKNVKMMKFDGAGHGVFSQHKRTTYPAMQKFFDQTLTGEIPAAAN